MRKNGNDFRPVENEVIRKESKKENYPVIAGRRRVVFREITPQSQRENGGKR